MSTPSSPSPQAPGTTPDPDRARALAERFEEFLRGNVADVEQIGALQQQVEAELGFQDTLTIRVAAYRATALAAQGRSPEALEVLESTLERAHAFQPGGPDETFLLEQVATLHAVEERFEQALSRYAQAAQQWTALTGGPNEQSLYCAAQAGECLLMLDRAAEAEAGLQQTVAQAARLLPPDHPTHLQALDLRASALFALERFPEAIKSARQHLKLLTHYFGAEDETTEEARRELAVMLCFGVDPEHGVPALEELAEETDRRLGPDTWQALGVREHLGLALGRIPERAGEGEQLLREIAAGYEAAHEHQLLARVLRGILVTVRNNPEAGPEQVRAVLAENASRLQAAFGAEHEKTAAARETLAEFDAAR